MHLYRAFINTSEFFVSQQQNLLEGHKKKFLDKTICTLQSLPIGAGAPNRAWRVIAKLIPFKRSPQTWLDGGFLGVEYCSM